MQFRVIEVIASTGFLTALECNQFVLAPNHAGGAYSDPQTTWFNGVLLIIRSGGEGRGHYDRRKGRGGHQRST